MTIAAITASSIVLTSLTFLAYVMGCYPLLLAWLAPRRARPIKRGSYLPSVSVILPVRNGERWIGDKLSSIFALEYPKELMEVIVISDGSTDRTHAMVESFKAPAITLLRTAPLGKAAALNVGIAAAKHEILLMTDVRQKLEPASLHRLVSCFADPEVGVASGDVVVERGASHDTATIHAYRRYESWIRVQLSKIDSMFGATGCLYAMRRELAAPLPPGTILDDMYLPLGAFFKGFRCVFDLSARAFDVPTSPRAEFSRKVRTLSGNIQLLSFYPQLLGRENRMLFHYISHKFARLLLPYALLATVFASFWLSRPWSAGALAVQALLYGIAILDFAVPASAFFKRVSSPLHTFLVMMAAAFCALSYFFVPFETLWHRSGGADTTPNARNALDT